MSYIAPNSTPTRAFINPSGVSASRDLLRLCRRRHGTIRRANGPTEAVRDDPSSDRIDY